MKSLKPIEEHEEVDVAVAVEEAEGDVEVVEVGELKAEGGQGLEVEDQ